MCFSDEEWVKCLLCDYTGTILAPHLNSEHHIDSYEYRRRFPGARIQSINSEKRFLAAMTLKRVNGAAYEPAITN